MEVVCLERESKFSFLVLHEFKNNDSWKKRRREIASPRLIRSKSKSEEHKFDVDSLDNLEIIVFKY